MADYTSTHSGVQVDSAVDNVELLVGAGLSGVNIDGGSMNGTVIGDSVPAAIDGTTGDFTGNVTLLSDLIVAAGFLNLGTATEITISSGAVTPTMSYQTIDTEADAAADDLVTINGGTRGDILILRPADSARETTLKHGTGNIFLDGGVDFTLTSVVDTITLIFAGSWVEISRSNNN